jgi:peptide/nickel transport system substrate-binding protein
MKKLRWQLIIILLTGLVVGVLLLGEQPVAGPQLKPEPVQGGIYTEALVGSLQRLNPVLDYYNAVDRDVDRLIYSGLIRFSEHGLPEADLAESWGISQDGTFYNFTLRSDAIWHDGQPVTSDDVVFTIELLREGGGVVPEDIQLFWQTVEVISLNAQNLQFQLPEPYAPFLDYLAFGILPQHLLGDLSFEQLIDSQFNLHPIGSGPFQVTRVLTEGNSINGVALTAFQGYYGKTPFIEQIILNYYADPTQALAAYQEGAVQGINRVTPDILMDVLNEPDLAVYTGRLPEISIILLNLDNSETPFFQEVEFRQALFSGLNRQWIIDRLLGGQAVITDLPILPGTWAYYDGHSQVEFDADQARLMLKEAGYEITGDSPTVREKEGRPVSFTLLYPDDENHRAIAESIQSDWTSLGLEVAIEAAPYDQLVNDRLARRDYQAALVDLNLARSPDPDPYPFWNQVQITNGQNYSQWDNRMASEYLEQARVEPDQAERKRLYYNFQVVFSQEIPALPLFYPVYVYAVDYEVQGIRMGPLFDSSDRLANVVEWFMEARLSSQSGNVDESP